MGTEAETVAALAVKGSAPTLLEVPGGPDGEAVRLLVTPQGAALTSMKKFLDEYRQVPERREGSSALTTLESFIAHANRFKDEDSAIFVDDGDEPEIVSVIDYHRAGSEKPGRFGKHRGVYSFPLSVEWTAWTEKAGKVMSQGDFAVFLEDRIVDVIDPSTALASKLDLSKSLGGSFAGPARLMELSRGLEVRVNSKVAQFVRLESGETQLNYNTEHLDAAGAPLKVPSLFLIQIPVFAAGALYQVPVRLRYRTSGGSVTWFYELVRAEHFLRDAIAEAADRAAKETGLPTFFGTPEA